MANLIPQLAKKKITTEYWLRVVTAWFWLWVISFVIASVLLFPVFIFTATQVGVYADSANAAEETVADHTAVSKELQKTNEQAVEIIKDAKQDRAYDYVQLFSSFETDDVVLNEMRFAKSGTSVEPIRLYGIASTRESLADFRERLLQHEAIEEVDLPISNLAKDSNINFDITVTMVKNASL